MVGGKNYTTVKYGIDKIAKAMQEDKELAYNIEVLEKKLGKSQRMFHIQTYKNTI